MSAPFRRLALSLRSASCLGLVSLLAACGGAGADADAKGPPSTSGVPQASAAPAGTSAPAAASASPAPTASAAASGAAGPPVVKLQAGMDKPITLEGTTPAKREISTPCGFFTKAPSAVIEVPEGGLKEAGLFLAYEKDGEGRRFLFASEGFDPATATLKDPKTHQCLPTSYVGKLPAGRHAMWVGTTQNDVAIPFKLVAHAPADPKDAASLLLLASSVPADLPVEKRILELHYPRLTELLLEGEVTTFQGDGRTKKALELRRQLWLSVPDALIVFAKPEAAKGFSGWPQPLSTSEPLLITAVKPGFVFAMTADGKHVSLKSVDELTTTRPEKVAVDTKRSIDFGPDDPQNKEYSSPQTAPLEAALKEADKVYTACFEPAFKPDAIPDSAISTTMILQYSRDGARNVIASAKADAVCKKEKAAFDKARAPLKKAQIEARKARHAEVIAEIAARFSK
jgi:hypothetical protein